jgi:hypothetical protein
MTVSHPSTLTRLIPFNPHRFDACMAYLAKLYGRPLSVFEMVKHHVMTDVYHVLKHGHQVIGGELRPWPYGPVVEEAYNRLKYWEHRHEESGGTFQPTEYKIEKGDLATFSPTTALDPEELSPSELEAMGEAIALLKPMSFDAAYRFFHRDESFMGSAYNRAIAENRALSWEDIIDSYDAIWGTNHQNIKRRLISYG